ncbi:acylneuraminate cytidylyltransferase family protein [Cetobacterium sp.]|uniref:acylneuraminate cytidylyltransferase family protein n=1 Tax=Cetobacterium sp. TaxID=2071632 RepID=UPI003F2F7EA6
MKKIAFMPLKLNNERLQGKNTMCLGEKKLYEYNLEKLIKLKQEKIIDEIYIFCSNDEIKKNLSNEVIFLKRPESLDTSKTTGNDICHSFFNLIKSDIYILIHATAPFLKESTIAKAIEKVATEHDSCFTVEKVQSFLWKNSKPYNYSLDNIPRTQDMEPFYIETTGLYVYRKEVIKNNRRIGNNPYLLEVEKIETVDIDEKEDFEFARKLV